MDKAGGGETTCDSVRLYDSLKLTCMSAMFLAIMDFVDETFKSSADVRIHADFHAKQATPGLPRQDALCRLKRTCV